MINKIKGAVKSALMEKKIEDYYAGLDEQFVSYDTWISRQEETYVSAGKMVSVQIIEFADCIGGYLSEFFSNGLKEAESAKGLKQSSVPESAGNVEQVRDSEAKEIVLFVNKKDNLASDAVSVIADYFSAHPECVLVYGDEDEWNSNRKVRMNPWFKPDFSPDTLLEYFYYGNVFAIRKNALDGVIVKSSEDCLTNLYDLCLQISLPVKKEKIGHLHYVLYHAQSLKRLCVDERYDEIRMQALDSVLKKELGNIAVRTQNAAGNCTSESTDKNKISVVIPSKDHPKIIEVCLNSLQKTVKNRALDIIVVDNGSLEENRVQYEELKVKYGFNYIYHPMDFNFSSMCNLGAEYAVGEYLLFLNDDIEAFQEGWLDRMCFHAAKSHVGAVGAKLYYPDSSKIQHAGITNLRLGPVHKLQFLDDIRPYYDGRNQYDHNVLAVTAACLLVRREVLKVCGGFCENLAVAFNDVEFCFRLHKSGFYNVVCNSIALYHHESLSRGNDESVEKQMRLQNERKQMYEQHPDLYAKDPFYHPYLNQEILDTNFSCEYQYPAGTELDVVEPVIVKGLQPEWYNECLLISMEYAGDLTAWIDLSEQKGGELYFQGYQFVIGSDNSCFSRHILLKNVDNEEIYELPCGEVFRPDLEKNVVDGHVSLCGFALVISKKDLPEGNYQVGCMAKSLISRQRLCRFVNKFVSV